MFPPFQVRANITLSEPFIAEFEALAIHDQQPRSTLAQENLPERVKSFDMWIERCSPHGFYCTAYQKRLDCHVAQYKCLNGQELSRLRNAIIEKEDERNTIYVELSETQNMIQYARMLSRSVDPEVIRHRKLIKKQLKESHVRHKDLEFVLGCYNKHIGRLWAVYSEKTKRTCDFEDEARESDP